MRYSLSLLAILAVAACSSSTGSAPIHPQLAFVAGANQTDTVGQTLPVQLGAKLTDALSGAPLGGRVLNWSVVDGAGQLFVTVTQTGSDGIARNSWTLGTLAGSQTAIARYLDPDTGTPLTLDTARATAVPQTAVSIKLLAGYSAGTIKAVGDTVAMYVEFDDQFGNHGAACPDGKAWDQLSWTFDSTVVKFVQNAPITSLAAYSVDARFVAIGTGSTFFSVTTSCAIGVRTASYNYGLNVH